MLPLMMIARRREEDAREQAMQLQTVLKDAAAAADAVALVYVGAAGPRLADMTVVVKMLGIVSNVVPKLVQRNFRNSLMLPLNECTRTWVAHIHTHTWPLGGNRI